MKKIIKKIMIHEATHYKNTKITIPIRSGFANKN